MAGDMSRRKVLGVAAAGVTAAALPARARERRPRARIPILAWYGPPAAETTVERYRELAACGFTENFSGQPNTEAILHSLEAGRETEIRLYVNLPEQNPEEVVRRIKDHPALGGYYLRDEPSAAGFPKLAEWVRRVQAVDTTHPCYINLFPTYASPAQLGTATYQEHVDRFIAQVPVPLLTFDHYPVTTGGLRADWYENLEIISLAARRTGKPFWAFVLAVAHGPYPIATVESMRLQAFSDLAYGAQAIQYFTYWTPDDKTWDFHKAPIDLQGKRTEVYERVRQVNAEIQGLARVFAGAKVLQIGHTGRPPRGTEPYRVEPPMTHLVTEGEGAVVSLLSNGGRRYLAVVNRDHRAGLAVALRFDGSRRVSEEKKEGNSVAVGKEVARTLAPGDLLVLGWSSE
jgi:hypothetical protein